MDTSSNSTPKTQKRRTLGLSRRIGVNISSTAIPITPIETTPDSTDTSLQSSKDERVPIIPIEIKSDSSDISQRLSAETPNGPIGRVSDSANSGIVGNTSTIKSKRHKLSLCKDTNDNMTRKRLRSEKITSPEKSKKVKLEPDSELFNKRDDEPKLTTKNENCDTKPTSKEAGEKVNSEPSTAALLQEEIDRIKKRITMTEKYQQQISDLQDLITKWKSAGLKTIEDIQEKIQPTEVSDILRHFNIDPELFELNTTE